MKAGIGVRPYTVNSEALMKRLFEIDCTAIITDHPEKAIKLKNSLENSD